MGKYLDLEDVASGNPKAEAELAALRGVNGTDGEPKWNDDGQPENLEAAANDALDWLNLFLRNKATGMSQENRKNLTMCREQLAEFLTYKL